MADVVMGAAAAFSCDVGEAVGKLVAKHGVAEQDAACVLLILATGMLRHLPSAEFRAVIDGAVRLGPPLMASADALVDSAGKGEKS